MTALTRRPPRARVRLALGLVIGLYAAAAIGAPSAVLPDAVLPDTLLAADTVTPPDPVVAATTVIAPAASAGAASSAITVNGKGEFADLKVTVSQTRNLINQVVSVSWTGGKPTVGDSTRFVADYLQIMQCWGGNQSKGPDRTQCQFGAYANNIETRGGAWTATRRITRSGEGYVDPNDPIAASTSGTGQVPFISVKGVQSDNPVPGQFFSEFDRNTTNEVALSPSLGDGTGSTPFEMQTYQEAPALGCGDATSGTPRSCWLVVVPRGEKEVDGTDLAGIQANTVDHKMDTSPLSLTNWNSRIVFPMAFEAVGKACALGSVETPLLGVETASEAVLRWQPALCANSGPVFGLSQVAEAVAERRLSSEHPGMVLLNGAVDPTTVPADRYLVYAPMAISGITIGALIQRQYPIGSTDPGAALTGKAMPVINLSPRVVAKLLTQSYRYGAAKDAGYLAFADGTAYPDNLTRDKDFLADNPDFTALSLEATIDVLLPLTASTANQLLWEWVGQDQDAADFIAGLPDPWGMRVNPFYQGLLVPQDQFPKQDPFCDFNVAQGAKPECTFDAHPYALDFHESARSVIRGDALARTVWDPQAQPPAYKKAPPVLDGQRHLLGVTDSASAARYGLVTARLKNASGAFVVPTAAALQAGAAALRPSAVDGVRLTDPTTTAASAYPLTTVTYAVTAPAKLTAEEAKAYGGFLRFAAGAGQTPGTAAGTLPEGYAPLSDALKAQAVAAAAKVEARYGPPATASDTTAASSAVSTSAAAGTSAAPTSDSATAAAAASGSPTKASVTSPNASPVGFSSPSPTTTTSSGSTARRLTPKELVGWVRFVTIVVLLLGISAALLGPMLPRWAWRPVEGDATPTGTTAPSQEALENAGEGAPRAPDEAMATTA
jgi:hypothetical protein